MMNSSFLPYLLGHFCVHCAAWFAMTAEKMTETDEGGETLVFIFLYLAVSLLLPILLCRLNDAPRVNARVPAAAGCLVSALGLLLAPRAQIAAVILLGAGTALTASAGMTDALTRNGGLSRCGIFAAFAFPGAALGKKLASVKKMPSFYLILLLCFAALLLLVFCRRPRAPFSLPEARAGFFSAPQISGIPSSLLLFFVLFAAVFAVLSAPRPDSDGRFAWLIPAAALFAGFFAGGVLSDVLGAKILAPCGLCLSAVLFFLGKDRFLFFAAALCCAGLAFSAVLGGMALPSPHREGTSVGFAAVAVLNSVALHLFLSRIRHVAVPAAAVSAILLLCAVPVFFTCGRNLFTASDSQPTEDK